MSAKRKAVGSDEPRKKLKSTEDGRLCLYEGPIALKDMAAIQVAIALWNHKNLGNIFKTEVYDGPYYYGDDSLAFGGSSDVDESLDNSNSSEDPMEHEHPYQLYADCYDKELRNDFSWDQFQDDVTSNLNKLPIWPVVKNIIERYIEPVKKNFKNWILYNHKRIFIHNHINYVYGLVDEVIWKYDGQVDYEKTARNLLCSPKVNEIEKYRLICTYCMEDEISNVSLRLFDKKYIQKAHFYDNPLIHYWNSYMFGTLSKIHRAHFRSINSRMLGTGRADNESAIRYFWNLLTEKEKLRCAKCLIQQFGVKHQNFVLTLLNEIQQHQVLLEMGLWIIKNYTETSSSTSKYAIPVWTYLQNFSDPEEFGLIFVMLFDYAWDICNIMDEDRTYVISLLRNLWRNTSNPVKNFLLGYKEKEIISLLLKGSQCTNLDENFKLLCEVLADTNTNFRKEVMRLPDWRNYHELLTEKGRTELLDYFVKLCVPESDHEVDDFWTNLMTTVQKSAYCLNLLKQKKFEELDQFLSSYLPDARTIADYKADLMLSDEGIAIFVEAFTIDSYKSLHASANKIIKKDVAVDLKRKIISSVTRQLCDWIENGNLGNVIDCLQLFLGEENDMKMAKETLLQSYRSEEIYKVFIHYDETQWQSFMLWCLEGSGENVSEFKKSLPLESIFTRFLQHSVFTHYASKLNKCKFRNVCSFIELDRFLRWFFITADEIRLFKNRQTVVCYFNDVIKILTRKRDNTYLKSVLNWLTDGYENRIGIIKSVYRGLKIANLI